MIKKILIVWLFLALQSFTNLWPLESPKPKDSIISAAAAYLGQTPPGDAAIIFAPDFISTPARFAGNSTFSPAGTEFYFSVTNNQWDNFEIMYTKFKNGAWTPPAKANFLENKFTLEPFYAPSGKPHLFQWRRRRQYGHLVLRKKRRCLGPPGQTAGAGQFRAFRVVPVAHQTRHAVFHPRRQNIFLRVSKRRVQHHR